MVISEYQDFVTIKTFMDFLILIFVINTSDSISENTFYLSKRKKFFSWSLWGTTGPKNFFRAGTKLTNKIWLGPITNLIAIKKSRFYWGRENGLIHPPPFKDKASQEIVDLNFTDLSEKTMFYWYSSIWILMMFFQKKLPHRLRIPLKHK